MPGPHWWRGGTDDSFDTGSNWDTGLVPATAEAWGMNHLATRNIGSGLNQAAKTFSRIVFDPLCPYGIPSALSCNATEVRWRGGGTPVYLTGTFTNIFADSAARTAPGLQLDAVFTALDILSGWVTLTGTRVAAAGSRISVSGREGAAPDDAQLSINAGTVDLLTNSTVVTLGNGIIETVASVARLCQASGLFRLGRQLRGQGDALVSPDACVLTLGEALGGSFEWNSTGTITAFHARGKHRFSLGNDLVRILTTATLGGDPDECVMDLANGHNLTVTNPIRVSGGRLIAPVGRTLAVAS